MTTTFYEQYLRSPHWQTVRHAALDAANHRCHLCGERNKPLDVHHKTYERLWHEQPADVVALCRPCHEIIHANPQSAEYALAWADGMNELAAAMRDAAFPPPTLTEQEIDMILVRNGGRRTRPPLPPSPPPIPDEEQDEPDGDPDEPLDYHWLLRTERRHRTPNGRNEPGKRDPMYNL